MDWAVGLAFPVPAADAARQRCHAGAEVPDHPGLHRQKRDTDTWEDSLNGGLLGVSDLLLRAQVMPTYLSHDWGRDWVRCGGSPRWSTPAGGDRAQHATRSGLWSPGHMRNRTLGQDGNFLREGACRSADTPTCVLLRAFAARNG